MKNKLREKGIELAKKGRFEDAALFLERAIDKGDYLAVNDLGVVYQRNGDYESAYKCYRISSDHGCGTATCNIGSLYENGYGVWTNYEKAVEYYKKAIEQKAPYAYYKLANAYRFGRGVDKDEKKALEILKQGAKIEKKFEEECTCIVELSYFYDVGLGTKPSMRKTFKYSKLAAKKNDEVGLYNLAECYIYGKGTFKNIKKAINLLIEATEQDYADAFYKLSEIYEKGIGVKKDKKTSELWLLEALKHNSFKAYLRYAEMCITGQDVKSEPDFEAAAKVIARFILEIDYSYVDELNQYEELKNKYSELLDWEDVESHAIEYVRGKRKREIC